MFLNIVMLIEAAPEHLKEVTSIPTNWLMYQYHIHHHSIIITYYAFAIIKVRTMLYHLLQSIVPYL